MHFQFKGDLPWQSYFTYVTLKHFSSPLPVIINGKICSRHSSALHLYPKFYFIKFNNMTLSRFPKDQYAPHSNKHYSYLEKWQECQLWQSMPYHNKVLYSKEFERRRWNHIFSVNSLKLLAYRWLIVVVYSQLYKLPGYQSRSTYICTVCRRSHPDIHLRLLTNQISILIIRNH